MFDYIKEYYKVPAESGRVITFQKRKGIIVKSLNNYIGVIFYDDKKKNIFSLHPTWEVEYLGIAKPIKPSRSSERYQRYLSSGSDLKFGDWLKKKCYKN